MNSFNTLSIPNVQDFWVRGKQIRDESILGITFYDGAGSFNKVTVSYLVSSRPDLILGNIILGKFL